MIATICRKFRFNSAHRLHNKLWSDEENRAVFGKCNNANYHGHNYELTVKITGCIDKDTGFVINIADLKQLVEKIIVERFDYKNLNLDTEEFKELNPTAEHIVYVIYNMLRPHINTDKKLQITLYETERNYVEYDGE